jgi:hypothetical protein
MRSAEQPGELDAEPGHRAGELERVLIAVPRSGVPAQ